MRGRRSLIAALLFTLGQVASAYAASGCGNLTLCVKDPPFPPNPPTCTTYPNFCSFVPQVQLEAPQPSAGPGYSLQFDNLSNDQLQKIFDVLGIDKEKVKVPQQ